MNHLTLPLAVAFLFFIGATGGWILEFFFRNLVSHKGPKGRYFINPGFCKGPWLPIYGIGIATLCILSELIHSFMDPQMINTVPATIFIILVMGLIMNCIELFGGLFLLKVLNMRLWDYTDRPGNFMGLVCPLFAMIWTGISAVYYVFFHEIALEYLLWFSKNLSFAFFVGLFFGFFILDIWTAFMDAKLIKDFADQRDIIVHYEDLKALMLQQMIEKSKKQQFFNQVMIKGTEIEDTLTACFEEMEKRLNFKL